MPRQARTPSTMIPKLALVAAAAFVHADLFAQTVTVTLPASQDTTLIEDPTGSLANGAGPSLFAGVTAQPGIRRAILQFDVAGNVPAGAKILSASLDLAVLQSSAFLPTTTFAHRVTQSWSEGTVVSSVMGGGIGATATAGETTWLHRDYPNVLWNNAGGDFAANASFTFGMPGLGSVQTGPLAGLVADVQDMLDNPAGNFGWLLKTDELLPSTARRIASREAATQQPMLTVTYLAGGQTGSYGVGSPVGGGTFQLAVTGAATGGTTLPIIYTTAPASSVGANFFSLQLDPIGTPLPGGKTVYLPFAGIVPGTAFLTLATGDGASAFTVPAGFPGYLIVVQAAVLDASPMGFSLSNAGVMVTQ